MHLVSGPVRVSRWMRAALAAAGLAAGLAGCVTTGAPPKSPYQKSTTDDDIRTASDQTAADRLSNTRMELAAAYLTVREAPDAVLLTTADRFVPPGWDRFRTAAGVLLGDAGT